MSTTENEIAALRARLAQFEKERDFYRSALEQVSHAVIFIELDGRIVYANDTFKNIACISHEDLFSGNIDLKTIIHPDDLLSLNEQLQQAYNGECASGFMRIGCDREHEHTVSYCAVQMTGPDGRLGIHVVLTDLSAEGLSHTRADEHASQSDPLYKWILDKAPIAIYRRSFGSGYEYFNEAFAKMFECSYDDINSKYGTPEQRWLDLNEHDQYISELLNKHEVVGFEIHTQPINGISKTLLLYAFIDDTYHKINGFAIDITAQKQLQDSVAEKQYRINSISDNFTQGLIYQVTVAPDGSRRFSYLSHSVKQLYGISIEEGLADANLLYRNVYPDDVQILSDAEDKSLLNLSPFRCEARFFNPSGGLRWSLLISTPTCLPDGSVTWNGIEFDITDRKTAELALQEREAQYRFITDNMTDVIWVLDITSRKFLYVSPSVLQQRGFTAEEMMGQTFESILTPESVEKANRIILQSVEERPDGTKKRYSAVNELDQYRKDGTIYPVELSTTITFDENGQAQQIIGITRDISERKRAEKKIIESETRYRSLFENVNDAIIIIKDYVFTDCNSHALVVFGCTRDEIIGKSPSAFSPEYQANGEQSQAVAMRLMTDALTGAPQRFEWIHIRQNRSLFYADVSLNRIEVNDEVFLTAMVRDISEGKNIAIELEKYRNKLVDLVTERTEELATTNEELTATNEELTATNEELYQQKEALTAALEKLTKTQAQLIQSEKMASLGVLAAGIAHEINNPLNFIASGIYGFEAFFEDSHFPLDDSLKMHLNAMYEGVRRASEIVKSLNQYSRSSGNTFELCNVNTILDNCTTMLSSQIKNKIEVIKQYAPNCAVIANEGRLHQALLNILANACQAIQANGVIRITTKTETDTSVIEISDNGGGIPEDIMPKIFDPFFTTKSPGQGTGLGLSISLSIIKEHGGTIDIDSNIGIGTTITITFPL